MVSESGVSALHGNVLTGLGQSIVSGELAVGDVITLDGVSAGYGVSRSVAREAIRVLESLGMIASRRRIGITIQPETAWNVFDARVIRWRLESGDRAEQLDSLAELRTGYLPVAAALAAQRADPSHCRTLAAASSDIAVHARSGDRERYLLADKLFHDTVVDACGNSMFRGLHRLVAAAPIQQTAIPDTAVVEAYDDVARAIRHRDTATAERSMRTIIDADEGGLTAARA
ncbi:FCD domain-containing protein [Mycobacterium sp. OTB74]|uniref:FadR/GntR family transcriptional regulator n=1 Tax=Mycobacterium sp. OTB74 TaxID=1853452 RepID=UPI002475E7F2|nr:FCD domain-containing protein [Mycobacterium sp. OTB74]